MDEQNVELLKMRGFLGFNNVLNLGNINAYYERRQICLNRLDVLNNRFNNLKKLLHIILYLFFFFFNLASK